MRIFFEKDKDYYYKTELEPDKIYRLYCMDVYDNVYRNSSFNITLEEVTEDESKEKDMDNITFYPFSETIEQSLVAHEYKKAF